MPTASTYALYCATAVALLLVPGPAVLYIVTRSSTLGRRAGLTSVVGIHTGSLVHVTAATVGLSALLLSSATAFESVRYAGAAFLVVMGVRQILDRKHADIEGAEPRAASRRRIYLQGVVVNVLNPKTALFLLAFVPQFVDPHRGDATWQVLIFGLTFVGLGLICDSSYALLAAALTHRIRRDPRSSRRRRVLSGGIFVGLGVIAAVSGQRPAHAQ